MWNQLISDVSTACGSMRTGTSRSWQGPQVPRSIGEHLRPSRYVLDIDRSIHWQSLAHSFDISVLYGEHINALWVQRQVPTRAWPTCFPRTCSSGRARVTNLGCLGVRQA